MIGGNSRKLACFAALALVGACGWLSNGDENSIKRIPETRDRLSEERMARLVAQPMMTVRKKGLVEGEETFERLLAQTSARYGPRSVQVADMLTSFGIELYIEDSEPGTPIWLAARHYLRDSIPAYRAAFGSDNPEVAVALNTYADFERVQSPAAPSPEVESLLEEALRIRIKSLGTNNPETVGTWTQLANIYALPSSLKKDPASFAKADAYYRRAIAGALTGPEGDGRSNRAAIELQLAKLHARSGNSDIAISEAKNALAISRDWTPPSRRCQLVESRFGEFAELMSVRGFGAQAEAIRPKGRDAACNYPIMD